MRYVILHHEGYGEPHYDLMIESAPGGSLMTWRAIDWPPVAGDELIRLADHRSAYLDYEGPVSDNRGRVRRIAAGACDVAACAGHLTIQIAKPAVTLIILRQMAGDRWLVVEVDP